MDPETERQVAAMIMEEAGRLRREAERDGVGAYLSKPKIRARANPQFLSATVRSIQQSNRIVEVNEMWRQRNVELENEGRRRGHWRRNNSPGEASHAREDSALDRRRHRHESDDEESADGGLKDEELEEFLHSRLKRGRGAVGSRMDETGPYLPSQSGKLRSTLLPDERLKDDWEERIVGPQAGPSLNGKHTLDWDGDRWERKQRDSSSEEAVNEEGVVKRSMDGKAKRLKRERESKRDSKKKKKKKLDKSSKRRR